MTLEMKYREIRKEGIAAGKAESILELLSEVGEVSENLKADILGEQNLELLKSWLKLAAKADSVEAFEAEMKSK